MGGYEKASGGCLFCSLLLLWELLIVVRVGKKHMQDLALAQVNIYNVGIIYLCARQEDTVHLNFLQQNILIHLQ